MAKRPRRALSRKAAAARRPVRKVARKARKAKKAKKTARKPVRRVAKAKPRAAKRTAKRPAARRAAKRVVARRPAVARRPVARQPAVARRAVAKPAKPAAAAPPKPVVAPAPKVRAPRQPSRPLTPPPGLHRERRRLPDAEAFPPTPPSSLDLDRHPSAARSGQSETREHLHDHNESSPALTGGDVDADWEQAYSSGDEAPGGDNPTPDQDIVDEIGRSLGLEYEDDEELKGAGKLEERDKHRWELDPASSEDYEDRD